MISNSELLELIEKARAKGAVINVTYDEALRAAEGRNLIDTVQIAGVKGCGSCAMPPISAAERLREFMAR